jgi:hypothetical protein
MSTQSQPPIPIPTSVLVTFFGMGAGLGWFAHYITLRIFDRIIRPRFFPNLPAHYGNRPEPENEEVEDEDEDPADARFRNWGLI